MDPTSAAAVGQTLDAQLLDLMLRAGSRWVLWLLMFLSIVAVAVIIERAVFFLLQRRPTALIARALATLRSDGETAALALLEGQRSMVAVLARDCLRHLGDGSASVEERAQATVQSERLRYERGLAYLGTLGNNAPFVGLFGTVLGIVRAFHDLSMNTAAGSQAVMAGIAEALVATAVGLLVALPAVAAYNTFARLVDNDITAAEAVKHAILADIKRTPPQTEPEVG